MALQTSGMISLGQIHAEAGGSATGACTINDSDIRGLIGKSSGAAMDFADWYGASSSLDQQTLTVGSGGGLVGMYYLSAATTLGSMSDGTCNFKGGAAYRRCHWQSSNNQLILALQGVHSNSGWTTMDIGGVTFNRTGATFANLATVETRWTWYLITSSPFGSAGGTKVVTFT